MNTYTLDRGTRLIGATRWSAIAFGVFLALAAQSLLLRFGFAVAMSGERVPVGAGYGLWVVIVEIVTLAAGAAIAARMSDAHDRAGGIAAGVMTWAVALVVGGIAQNTLLGAPYTTSGIAWFGFVAALLGLGAAIAGGIFGVTVGHHVDVSTPVTDIRA